MDGVGARGVAVEGFPIASNLLHEAVRRVVGQGGVGGEVVEAEVVLLVALVDARLVLVAGAACGVNAMGMKSCK